MKLRDFLKQASNIKEELLDLEVVIKTENGQLFEPKIKFIPKDLGTLALDKESIDKAIITYEE